MPIARNIKVNTGGNFGSPKFDTGGCVLYAPLWRQDQAGSPFQSSGAYGRPTHTCTVTGAVRTPQGRLFDGLDDKIAIPHAASLMPATTLTLEGWVYNTDQTAASEQTIVSKDNATNRSYFLEINNVTTTGKVKFKAGTVDTFNSNAGEVALNTWYHLVGTHNGSAMKIYKNGVEIATVNDTNAIGGNTQGVAIGDNEAYDLWFKGTIGEVRIYNRALTALEVQRNYLVTKWRYN